MSAAPATDPVVARILAAREGRLALLVARMASGWLVLNDTQPVRGYCQLLADPIVPSLNALDEAARSRYLLDTVRAGDALLAATGAERINYETWCNLAPTLHTHIVPRYADEALARRIAPVCVGYADVAARPADAAADAGLIREIRDRLGGG